MKLLTILAFVVVGAVQGAMQLVGVFGGFLLAGVVTGNFGFACLFAVAGLIVASYCIFYSNKKFRFIRLHSPFYRSHPLVHN